MNIFLATLLIIAMALGGERECAHAFSAIPGDGSMAHDVSDPHSHHGMDHSANQMDHGASDHHDNHCPDECMGGTDCAGCSVLSPAIFVENAADTTQVFSDVYARLAYGITQIGRVLDPPPPKFTSLI